MVRSVAEDDAALHCVSTLCCEAYINAQGSFHCLHLTWLCETAGCWSKSIWVFRQLFNDHPQRSVFNWTLQAVFFPFSPKLSVCCLTSWFLSQHLPLKAETHWYLTVSSSIVTYFLISMFTLFWTSVFLSHMTLVPVESCTFVYWIRCRNAHLCSFFFRIYILL